jgi:hypothetical protein
LFEVFFENDNRRLDSPIFENGNDSAWASRSLRKQYWARPDKDGNLKHMYEIECKVFGQEHGRSTTTTSRTRREKREAPLSQPKQR